MLHNHTSSDLDDIECSVHLYQILAFAPNLRLLGMGRGDYTNSICICNSCVRLSYVFMTIFIC